MKKLTPIEYLRTLQGIFDQYDNMYLALTGGRTSNYIEYVCQAVADEEKLIQPTLFPEFMEHILGFSKKVDYIPELSGAGGKTPDFTPTDTDLHPFVFETKGSDSSYDDLLAEYERKSRIYLHSNPTLRYVIITNMSDLIVFNTDDKIVDDFSFNFPRLYHMVRSDPSKIANDENVKRFLRFINEFSKKPLSTDDKIRAISRAKPHDSLMQKLETDYLEFEKLTQSIRLVIEDLRNDIVNVRGQEFTATCLRYSPDRKASIAKEIYSLMIELEPTKTIPEDIQPGELDKLLASKDKVTRQAIGLYYYRVAYFMMARLVLIRAWEDSRFLDAKYQTLYNGGFSKWYFETYDQKIADVLRQAFTFAREKYEWLFTDLTNYSWYIPSDRVLVDVLYELARYNLSVLNRDVLGTVYEEYLDIQDKKNKGQYYTPYPIVELIWDELGFSKDSDYYRYDHGKRVPKNVLDPSTGSGGFLVEAARRIRVGTFPSSKLSDLEDIKDSIVKGLYGSELSTFSYYISEINLLLQLTPVIKSIIGLNPDRALVEGKFTLSLINVDSLSLHSLDSSAIEQSEVGKEEIKRQNEILRPTGEKLNVFHYIKDHQDFDYVVANPPYIGEDGHKQLFRRTLERFPYWQKFYQGKMDYLYFFIELGLQKLREGGKLGFITTSYWLTADGASKLRKYILDNARILEIINFNEIKLFEHAKGQHNIIFILQKTGNKSTRDENVIRLVDVKHQPDGRTVNDRIKATCRLIRSHAREKEFFSPEIDFYDSHITQGKLSEKAWYLFHKKDVGSLLETIETGGKPLKTLCDVNQGLISRAHKVANSVLTHIPEKTIVDEEIKPGDGLFVLSKEEVESLELGEDEKALIKPFFKNSDILRYVIADSTNPEYVIYTTASTDIDKYPKIKKHLWKFKTALEALRDNYGETYPWYKLHRERDPSIFEGHKIVCPYRSEENVFALSTGPFYGSTDMYFITLRANQRLDQKEYNLHYILGILNSKVIKLWTLHKTKPKGRIRELFPTALKDFPIKEIDFSESVQLASYERIIDDVNQIISLKEELKKFTGLIGPINSSLNIDEQVQQKRSMLLNLVNPDEMRPLHLLPGIEVNLPESFILKGTGKIGKTIERENGPPFVLPMKDLTGTVHYIYGTHEHLCLVKDVIGKGKELTKNAIDEIQLPIDIAQFDAMVTRVSQDITTLVKRIESVQKDIDGIVCNLYSVDESDLDAALSTPINGDTEPEVNTEDNPTSDVS